MSVGNIIVPVALPTLEMCTRVERSNAKTVSIVESPGDYPVLCDDHAAHTSHLNDRRFL
jgi:hypothetical protein